MSLAAVSGPAAGQAEQRWGQPGTMLAELTVQLPDLVGEGPDVGDLGLADPYLHQAAGVGGGLGEPGGDATQARAGQPA